jgi:hypothetical protein
MYVSDHTKFMRELMQQNPALAEAQQKGRATWWDKPVDLAEQQRFQQSRQLQPSYVYQSKG